MKVAGRLHYGRGKRARQLGSDVADVPNIPSVV